MDRKDWMGLLARAPADRLAALWAGLDLSPGYRWLRTPEVGAAMVRGRAGGTGAPFNLGEMTVTRCSLQLDSGEVGHGYVQGRDKDQATLAALTDAVLQSPVAAAVQAGVLAPLLSEMARAKTERAAKAAATKVEFFTMVRGED